MGRRHGPGPAEPPVPDRRPRRTSTSAPGVPLGRRAGRCPRRQRQFFVRGHLPIPVRDHDEAVFSWNVWVQVSRLDYRVLTRTLNDAGRVSAAPVVGVLDSRLPYEPATAGLPVELHNRAPGEVPYVRATSLPGHPLQLEQEQGMSVHRLAELNRELLA